MASRDPGEPSALIRQRVNRARAIQVARFQKRGIHANAQMGTKEIKRYCIVEKGAESLLEIAINKLGLSARAYSRILKVSRTIADLEGSETIQPGHISEAIQYRSLDRRL
jgi:magnesium chelatase family protein